MSRIPDAATRLATLFADRSWQTPALLRRATDLMALKRQERLSRTNAHGDPVLPPGPRRRVLVVDRGADETLFGAEPAPVGRYAEMLRAARADHPEATIIVLRDGLHGALGPGDLALGDLVLDAGVDLVALVEQMDAVYVVGGLVGLEAILCERPVTCFGAPFYAGLGLTDERPATAATRPPMSREALFAAAYIVAPVYTDPLDGRPCEAEVALRRLAAFKRHARRVAGSWVGLNIPPVKDAVLRDFLAGPASTFTPRAGAFPSDRDTHLAAWASRPNGAVRRAKAERPRQVVQIEDGFLRSAGLGSAFHAAASLVIDRGGIYYDPASSSDLEGLIERAADSPELQARARALRQQIVALGLSKYNLPGDAALSVEPTPGRRTLLVPGQVENDASVLSGGDGVTNLALLRRVRQTNPDAWIVYRPHPDVAAGHRPGAVAPRDALVQADRIESAGDILSWIQAVDEVHTLTSLTGFEALLRQRPVVTYGWPFYAGRELTRDLATGPAPKRKPVGLDALVAATLILYPLYLDPVSRLPCDAETYLSRLSEMTASSPSRLGPLGRYLTALSQLLRPSRPRPY